MTTKKLTILSISTALQVCLLLVCLVLPTVKISMLFCASILNGVMCSAGYKKSFVFLSFIATSALSILLISSYIIPVAYILFFGGYGIVHYASIDKKPLVKQIIRYGYLVAGVGALYLIFKSLFASSMLLTTPYIYFLPIIIVIGYMGFQIVYNVVIKQLSRNSYFSRLIADK